MVIMAAVFDASNLVFTLMFDNLPERFRKARPLLKATISNAPEKTHHDQAQHQRGYSIAKRGPNQSVNNKIPKVRARLKQSTKLNKV